MAARLLETLSLLFSLYLDIFFNYFFFMYREKRRAGWKNLSTTRAGGTAQREMVTNLR